jgi:hypothetical protein
MSFESEYVISWILKVNIMYCNEILENPKKKLELIFTVYKTLIEKRRERKLTGKKLYFFLYDIRVFVLVNLIFLYYFNF